MFFPALPHLRAYAPMHGWLERELATGRELLLGRLPQTDFCLPDGSVSRRHARVVMDEDRGLTVRDDQSSYGVLVRGKREAESRLKNSESFQLGCFVVEFDDGDTPSDPALAPWRERGFRPLPHGMTLEWSLSGHANAPVIHEPSPADAYPGGLLALSREDLPPGTMGQAVLTWPDGTRFVLPAKALQTLATRRGRLTAFRLYRPSF